MNGSFQKRLRKAWYLHRKRSGRGVERPSRLIIEKAQWLGGASSPVMLGVDDLTNAYHSRLGGTDWSGGGDWGGALDRPGSALNFLEQRLLRDFPEIRITFFTVAGPISPYTHHQPFTYAQPLDRDAASQRFFRRLAADHRFELAFHGYSHGTPGETSEGFVQEFVGFPNRKVALETTRRAMGILERTTGHPPFGGKYGGYRYNSFAESVLCDAGFHWWCRDWTPRDVSGAVAKGYYEPQFFGTPEIVSLPTTVHGYFWDTRQIDLLVTCQQIVSIAEHISPVRPDGLVQTPNVVDDIAELRRLFGYLRRKPVWHATGTEIASYVVARDRTVVHDIGSETFSLLYQGRVPRPLLTLRIDASCLGVSARPALRVEAPDGSEALSQPSAVRQETVVTIPVMTGTYRVRAYVPGRDAIQT